MDIRYFIPFLIVLVSAILLFCPGSREYDVTNALNHPLISFSGTKFSAARNFLSVWEYPITTIISIASAVLPFAFLFLFFLVYLKYMMSYGNKLYIFSGTNCHDADRQSYI